MAINFTLEIELYRLDASTIPDGQPGANGKTWFAVVVTPSVEPPPLGTAVPPLLLQPWRWSMTHAVLFRKVATADPWSAEPKTIPFTPTAAADPALIALLDHEYQKSDVDPVSSAKELTLDDSIPIPRNRPWSGILRNAARWYGDIPQQLNLVRYFQLDNAELQNANLLVAPLITDGTGAAIAGNPQPPVASGDQWVSSYTTHGAFDSARLLDDRTNVRGPYRKSTVEWQPLNGSGVLKPWADEIPRLLADSLMLPAAIIEWYRPPQPLDGDSAAAKPVLQPDAVFSKWFARLLLRGAATGHRPGASGKSFWEQMGDALLEKAAKAQLTNEVATFVTELQNRAIWRDREVAADNAVVIEACREALSRTDGEFGKLPAYPWPAPPGPKPNERPASHQARVAAFWASFWKVEGKRLEALAALPEAALQRLLLAVITDVPPGGNPNPVPAVVQLVTDAVLEANDLRQQMLARPPFAFWPGDTDTVDLSSTALVHRLKAGLIAFIAAPAGASQPEIDLLAHLRDGAKKRFEDGLEALKTVGGVTRAFTGLTYQLEAPRAAGAAAKTSEDERLGYLPLLRKHGTNEWICLSRAKVKVKGSASIKDVAVPKEIPTMGGLVQAQVEYANHPLASPCRSAELAKVRQLKGGDSAIAWFELLDPEDQNKPWLPRLVFGETYHMAAAVVGPVGNLNWEICDPAAPWQLLPQVTQAGGGHSKELKFERTTPSGQLRIAVQCHNDSALIQDKIDSRWGQHGKPRDGVLLLFTDNTQNVWRRTFDDYTVRVLPPLLDWDNWTAHRATLSVTESELRGKSAYDADVLDETAGQQAKGVAEELELPPFDWETASPSTSATGTTEELRDPIITGIRWSLKKPDGTEVAAPQTANFAGGPASKIVLRLAKTAAAALPGELFVQAPAAGLHILEIQPLVAADAPISQALRTQMNSVVTNLYLEVAEPFVHQETTVAKHLMDRLSIDAPVTSSEIRLLLSDFTQSELIGAVEFRWQEYFWDGRPLAYRDAAGALKTGFPFDEDEKVFMENDLQYFAGRPDFDVVPVTGRRTANGGWENASRIPRPNGATYHRFGVRIRNRYAPLLRAQFEIDGQEADTNQPRAWKRHVCKARRERKLLPPPVKLVLPLTLGQFGKVEDAPGFLVVMEDEALARSVLGLADRLVARVEEVAAPYLERGTGSYREEGQSATRVGLPRDGVTLTQAGLTPKVRGPIGYTFDTSSQNARYARSSYFVELHANDLTWLKDHGGWADYSVKLQFQRQADDRGLDVLSPSHSIASDWTDGYCAAC